MRRSPVLLLVLPLALGVAACAHDSARRVSAVDILGELRATPAPAEHSGPADGGVTPLSEADAIRLAAAHSPALRAGEAALVVAESSARVAEDWPASEVRVNDIGATDASDTLEKFHIAYRWHLPNPFARGPLISAAEAAVPAAQADLEAASWELRHDVRTAWAALAYARARAEHAVKVAEVAAETARHVAAGVERGVQRPGAALEAELDRIEAANARDRATVAQRTALGRLARLVGRSSADDIAVPPTLTTPLCPAPPSAVKVGGEGAADDLIVRHPLVRRLEADYARADALLEAAEARRIPFLNFVQGAYEYDPAPRIHGFQMSISIELPIDAWSGRGIALESARRDFAEAALRQAVAEHADDADDALGRWQRAFARVALFDETLRPVLTAAVRQAKEDVAAGTATELEHLQARRKVLRAEEAALDARYDCHTAWLEAERAAGGSLTGE